MELSHAGPMTENDLRPLGKPEMLPGVGSSDLVRRRVHLFKPLNLLNIAPNMTAGMKATMLNPAIESRATMASPTRCWPDVEDDSESTSVTVHIGPNAKNAKTTPLLSAVITAEVITFRFPQCRMQNSSSMGVTMGKTTSSRRILSSRRTIYASSAESVG